MRVLYDYQAFMQKQGGVSRYFVELITALKELEGYEAYMPAFYSDNEYLEAKKTFLTRGHFKGKERIMGVLNRLRAGQALKGDFDVFHPTYYRPYFQRSLSRPFVITVHDMIHEIFSGNHVRDDGTARNKRVVCARASRIIAVSRNTKNDVCRLLSVPESKVSVIHHATNIRYAGEPRLHERPYVLYVGARSGYKNFARFLEAAAPILKRHDVDLLCMGGGGLTRSEVDSMQTHGIMDRLMLVPSADAGQLASLYHHASLFCYPSLYEGFGIPLLEAFACDCPVVASGTSCVPEVTGEAAELFDPQSVESIAAGIQRVLLDRERAEKLVAEGRMRLQNFSWLASARKTFEVYRQAS